MWCTGPHITIGTHTKIIEAWGFKPSTVAFVWVKENPSGNGLHNGQGSWTRANAEVCFIATRGSPLRLANDVHQVVMAPVADHSAKPEEVRRRIEHLFAGPYLELYGREPLPGWTVWGNEIPARRIYTAGHAGGRMTVTIPQQRESHGAVSLASVAKGVRSRHEKYPAS